MTELLPHTPAPTVGGGVLARTADPLADRLGRGWAFPARPAGGPLPVVSGALAVRQSVRLLLSTEPGERVMRPDFGCPLRQFLMAPNTPATRAAIGQAVLSALTYWERRITVTQVDVAPVAADPTVVVITIGYQHASDAGATQLQLAVPVGGAA